jgi:hypothetical protein
MPTRQGDVALLNDPVAQRLLRSTIPARLAYTWTDGTPRVIPIAFHWDGREIVLGSPANAPKMPALARNPKVALTIDTNEQPCKVLLVRGTATIEVMDTIVPEYAAAMRRYIGDESAAGWLAQLTALLPAMGGMARVAIRPEWVGIIDFEERFPSAIERAIAGRG